MIGIIIITYNIDCRIFILQVESIKRFCNDEYTIEIVDNSTNEELAEAIKFHAKEQGVNYHKTIPSLNDPSNSHAFAANISYRKFKDQYDIFFYLDHDCIPVKDFSVTEILGDNLIAGVLQGQAITKYFWPGCLMFKKEIDPELIDFLPNNKLRTDTGGGLHKIIEVYGYEKCALFDEVGCQNPYFQDKYYYFYMLICNGAFLHFLNSSNWRGVERNEERLNSLINITQNKINDYLSDIGE